MTRVIVMDREDHEPLTIVEISASWFRAIQNGTHPKHIRLLIEEPLTPSPSYAEAMMNDEFQHLRTVMLSFERVSRATGGRRLDGGYESEIIFWYAYADNPELALLLRAAFLPGQQGEVRRREKAAYLNGIFDVLFR